nr:hypothetical protein [uncultured Chryseobacterium sp.]
MDYLLPIGSTHMQQSTIPLALQIAYHAHALTSSSRIGFQILCFLVLCLVFLEVV